MTNYVELRTKSFYSFGEGASHVHELLTQAKQFGCSALGLTDTNLCGALEFARLARSLDIQPISGAEFTLASDAKLIDGSTIALLAKNRTGYANISRLLTLANATDRRNPKLNPSHLADHAEGVIFLSGGRNSALSRLAIANRFSQAHDLLQQYMGCFGASSTYVELHQNLLAGDTARNRKLIQIAEAAKAQVVATNNVHYHIAQRYRLQHALVAARLNTTIDQALPHLHPNNHLHLKPPNEMALLFAECPEAVANTLRIASQCSFDLSTDLGYSLPDVSVPPNHTPQSYLEKLCWEGAQQRYGQITTEVRQRLEEEFDLIAHLNLAGFLLLYHQIALLGRQILVERGEVAPHTPLAERPPGRGRGSSVALLIGYLIGISHVDPLRWNLTLERFISPEMTSLPDIDLDFPRGLRDELIKRVHEHFGPQHAVLVGAINTYKVKSIIQDLGKALGLPQARLKLLSKRLHSRHPSELRNEMAEMAEFKSQLDAPRWQDFLDLAPQLMGGARSLSQHVGGMVLSSSPIPEMVPIREGAIAGRHIMDWDKDSVADSNFAKIDILSLPVLDQIDEAIDLICVREGRRPDLAQINPDDARVYNMINAGLCKGVFLLQSPAQLKMAQRLRSRNLLDLAYQVALIRPGVGVQGSAVSKFVERYRNGVGWDYDHPLEKRALERGCGIIVWQEQVVQLIEDIGQMSASEADEVRRAFSRPNNEHLLALYRERFFEGAERNGIDEETTERIFSKINGHYMFPESHSHAFAVSAYQAAWLKRYYPVEFFVSLINNQPMGFYPFETLKQDARHFGVSFLNPCVNRSGFDCSPEYGLNRSSNVVRGDSVIREDEAVRRDGVVRVDRAVRLDGAVRLGLRFIKDVGEAGARRIVDERQQQGLYGNAGDLVQRVGLQEQAIISLVEAGAFDGIASDARGANRREILWEAGLQGRALGSGQAAFRVPTANRVPRLVDFTDYEKMIGEYRALGMYPRGHLMEFLRPKLGPEVLATKDAELCCEGDQITVAGWPIARQHPHGRDGTVFVTIEDETGDLQVIVFAKLFARRRRELHSQVVVVSGRISLRDETLNLVATDLRAFPSKVTMPPAHDWH